MKKNKLNIFYSWLLMFCFTAGQFVIYAHQHKLNSGIGHKIHSLTKNQTGPIMQEKCALCDAMHHTDAIINAPVSYIPNIVTKHFYKVYNYDFVSIALILAAGRAPPAIVVA